MKRRIQVAIIFAAIVCVSLSACGESETSQTNKTPTESTVKTSVATVPLTTQATETTVLSSIEVETAEAIVEVVAETTVTTLPIETPEIETEMPQIYEPTEPVEEVVVTEPIITDDTPIPHEWLCTDENMRKVTSVINNYFVNLGSPYNPTLNKDNCGWFLTQTLMSKYEVCSVNKFTNDTLVSFINEANAFLEMSDATYTDWIINCYAERQPNGEYNIYFCHE